MVRPYYWSMASPSGVWKHLISHLSSPSPVLISLSHVSYSRAYPRARSTPHTPVHPLSRFHDLTFKFKLQSLIYHLEFEEDVSISIIFIVYLKSFRIILG